MTMLSDAERSERLCLNRRHFLASAGAFVAWTNLPAFANAADRDPRLIVVILRGAMDGLAVVPPVGDPDYVSLRGHLAIGAPGLGRVLPLDGFFALNDAMPLFHKRFLAGEAAIFHAAATSYRERSHFAGQDVLESGLERPLNASGWLNRAVAALPAGESVRPNNALAASATVPLILRGSAPTLTWMPASFREVADDTQQRLLDLYSHTDPELARVFQEGVSVEMLADASGQPQSGAGGGLKQLVGGAAKLLSTADGPRIGALSIDGWDTHVREGPDDGRLAKLLGTFDVALETLATELKETWRDTVVIVVTEFGRTARANGVDGTDHGTATTALLFGGAVKGKRVIADWPGLKEKQLYEGRDLAPTMDLRAVFKGVLRDHLGLSERVLATDVFPGSLGIRPMDDLLV
jgi:uncharacterized protein (DUF1501 family)